MLRRRGPPAQRARSTLRGGVPPAGRRRGCWHCLAWLRPGPSRRQVKLSSTPRVPRQHPATLVADSVPDRRSPIADRRSAAATFTWCGSCQYMAELTDSSSGSRKASGSTHAATGVASRSRNARARSSALASQARLTVSLSDNATARHSPRPRGPASTSSTDSTPARLHASRVAPRKNGSAVGRAATRTTPSK